MRWAFAGRRAAAHGHAHVIRLTFDRLAQADSKTVGQKRVQSPAL